MQMQFKKYFPNKWYDVLYLAIYLFLLVSAIRLIIHNARWMYGASLDDSLYNFAGGFIRRGLGGEILFLIQDWLHIPMARTIYLVLLLSYFFLVGVTVRAFRKKGYGCNVLIMSFALGGALVYGFDECRRDSLELALLAMVLLTFRRLPFKWWLVLGNILITLGIALHEATFFFTVPALVAVTYIRIHNLLKSICCWLAPTLVFCLCCVCKGTPEALLLIAERAGKYAPQCFCGEEVPELLRFVGRDAVDVFRAHLTMNFYGMRCVGPVPVPTCLLTLFYFIYILYVTVAMLISFTPGGLRAGARNTLVRIILFQFVCLIPMFTILSCDIGRVAGYWIISSLLIWVFAGEGLRLWGNFGGRIDTMSGRLFSRRVPGRLILTMLMLVIGVVYFAPQYSNVLHSSVGWRVLEVAARLARHI